MTDSPTVRLIPPTVFTPEERACIRNEDLKILSMIMRIGKELAYYPDMATDDPDMESVLSVDEDRKTYTILFIYPPRICGMTLDKLAVFATYGVATGQLGQQSIRPCFERYYTDPDTGEKKLYDVPRWCVEVTMLMWDNPNPIQHSTKVIIEEAVQVLPRSANGNVNGIMVSRRREATTSFSQESSPRVKRPREQTISSSSTHGLSPAKKPRASVLTPTVAAQRFGGEY